MSLLKYLPEIEGSYRENVPLYKTNWFGVGGNAEILFKPKNDNDLSNFLKNKPEEISVSILGVGSNVIIRDGGIDGVVVKLAREFAKCSLDEVYITVGAGCLSGNFSQFAMSNELSGAEFLSGIPGTIGGNLMMNAGAYGSEIANILVEAIVLDENGVRRKLTNQEMGFKFRGNSIPINWIFVEAKFKLFKEKYSIIKDKMDFISESRNSTQPIKNKTCGSSFKNPQGLKAWELIDKAGCRGMRLGGAIISEQHCNFLINDDNASAEDLENLGEIVRQKVYSATGVNLEWEIKIIGNKIKS